MLACPKWPSNQETELGLEPLVSWLNPVFPALLCCPSLALRIKPVLIFFFFFLISTLFCIANVTYNRDVLYLPVHLQATLTQNTDGVFVIRLVALTAFLSMCCLLGDAPFTLPSQTSLYALFRQSSSLPLYVMQSRIYEHTKNQMCPFFS